MEDKVINRIKKMLALANDAGASEGERDNALRMVYSTLAKHNLTMATVENHSTEEKRIRKPEPFYGRPWAISLAHAVAEMFFCEYFYMRSTVRNQVYHNFIGKESNSTTAMEMAKYLVSSIHKEANRSMRERGEGAAWRRSFSLGAMNRIRTRIRELKAEVSSDGSTGTSLVLASLYDTERDANRNWMVEVGIKTKEVASRAKNSVDPGAYGQGSEFGKSINLNLQLGSQAKPELLD